MALDAYDWAAMKLIIQIPCLNEEATLPETLADLPREVADLEQTGELGVLDRWHGHRTRAPHVGRGGRANCQEGAA